MIWAAVLFPQHLAPVLALSQSSNKLELLRNILPVGVCDHCDLVTGQCGVGEKGWWFLQLEASSCFITLHPQRSLFREKGFSDLLLLPVSRLFFQEGSIA